jgi:hypothetical protein
LGQAQVKELASNRHHLDSDGKPHTDPCKQSLAALGLSWRKRADAGHKLIVPAIDFGKAQLVLLPGNLRDWCWVGPSETVMTEALKAVLQSRK